MIVSTWHIGGHVNNTGQGVSILRLRRFQGRGGRGAGLVPTLQQEADPALPTAAEIR